MTNKKRGSFISNLTVDKPRISKLVASLIEAMGQNLDDEGLHDTPSRVAQAFEELTSGYSMDPKRILEVEFNETTGMIVAKDIGFFSLCEHHLLPFFGRVHIGYIPNSKIVGISKLVRLVDCFSRRLSLQERITRQIADSLDKYLKPSGVIVVAEASHMCMRMRGVRNSSQITTSEIRGAFKDAESREEFFDLLSTRRNGNSH